MAKTSKGLEESCQAMPPYEHDTAHASCMASLYKRSPEQARGFSPSGGLCRPQSSLSQAALGPGKRNCGFPVHGTKAPPVRGPNKTPYGSTAMKSEVYQKSEIFRINSIPQGWGYTRSGDVEET